MLCANQANNSIGILVMPISPSNRTAASRHPASLPQPPNESQPHIVQVKANALDGPQVEGAAAVHRPVRASGAVVRGNIKAV